MMENHELAGVLEAALAIAEKEEKLIEQIRQALLDGNDQELKRLVGLLCGVPDEKCGFVH